jgi:hypothetical protein
MTTTRKVVIGALMLWTMTVTCLRTLRAPNDFAEAHWLLDYRFGFVRRGLVGEILSLATGLLSIPITSRLIAALAAVSFAILCGTIALVAVRIARRLDWSPTAALVSLVFLSSPFVVMNAHLNGYYDGLVIVLGVASVALLIHGRPWAAACLQIVAVLVHENALLLVFPLFCLTWLLVNRQRRHSAIPVLPRALVFLPVVAFAFVVIGQFALAKDFVQLYQARLSTFPFIQADMNTLVPVWVSQSFMESLEAGKSVFLSRLTPMYVLGLLFSALAIIGVTVDIYRLIDVSLEWCALVAVSFAPQLMHLVAFDTARIWTYSTLASFLVLWVYTELFTPNESSSATRLWCLFALAANAAIATPLMDGLSDRFDMRMRLLLYAPVVAGATILLITSRSARRVWMP